MSSDVSTWGGGSFTYQLDDWCLSIIDFYSKGGVSLLSGSVDGFTHYLFADIVGIAMSAGGSVWLFNNDAVGAAFVFSDVAGRSRGLYYLSI